MDFNRSFKKLHLNKQAGTLGTYICDPFYQQNRQEANRVGESILELDTDKKCLRSEQEYICDG